MGGYGAISIQGNCIDRSDRAGCNGAGFNTEDVMYTLNTIDRPAVYDARGNGDGETVPTITGDHGNRVTDYTAVCVEQSTYQDVCGTLSPGAHPGSYNGQDANNNMFVANTSLIRRLTPLEATRCQGFPDGWVDLGDWTDENGKKHKESDSPKYKALGNSIALPFWYWLLKRISDQCIEKTMGSLFSGVGGFDLCWQMINGDGSVRWSSEIDSYCIAVMKKRFGDETTGEKGDWREVLLGRNKAQDV